jgi:hypothetical protein
MKLWRNLACAIILLGAIAFCAPAAKAVPFSFTTNYDVLNITAIIHTNVETIPKPNIDVYTLRAFTLNNTVFLELFESWRGSLFPAGAKMVVSWDAGENVANGKDGDILVVDKTGINVLYDASEKIWSQSGKSFMTINFFNGDSDAFSANENGNSPGHDDFTSFSNASLEIDDGEGLFISTTGPSTDISTQGWNKNGPPDFTTWSDSDRAVTYGAGTNVDFGGIIHTTATIKISASGHGPGVGGFFYDFIY